MPRKRILIVDDEPDIVELLRHSLEREGFDVLTARDGEEGLALARDLHPDLVVLDLLLPGLDGLEVTRELKADRASRDIPLVMLTAKSEESDVVLGLGLGADDYVEKPFRTKELVARLRAVLRRSGAAPAREREELVLGEVLIDLAGHEVQVGGVATTLTRAEFRLLSKLVAQPGRVFTRSDLTEEITQGESIILDRNVDVHVSTLRRKLGAAGAMIVTVRGVGYKCRA